MSHDLDVVFTVDQIAACNTALRTVLGLPPEHVSTADFIGMISDKIEGLRTQGWSDTAIATLIHESTGSVIEPESIAEFYRPPDQRSS